MGYDGCNIARGPRMVKFRGQGTMVLDELDQVLRDTPFFETIEDLAAHKAAVQATEGA